VGAWWCCTQVALVSTEEQRSAVMALIDATDDWLYADGRDVDVKVRQPDGAYTGPDAKLTLALPIRCTATSSRRPKGWPSPSSSASPRGRVSQSPAGPAEERASARPDGHD
jgi:hypothetical protein